MFPIRIFLILSLSPALLLGQQVSVTDHVFSVNGQEQATLRKTKNQNELPGFELVKSDGTLLLSALPNTQIPVSDQIPGESIYAFQFEGVAEPIYLPIKRATAQQDLNELLTSMELIKDGEIDAQAVHYLRKKQGLVAPQATLLPLVNRDRYSPITLRRSGEIRQANKVIGRFTDLGTSADGMEHYAIVLPGGERVAAISFNGGSETLEFTVETVSDALWHPVRRETQSTVEAETGTDRNEAALKRIVPWLVENGYL